MIAIGLGLAWGGYAVAFYGYCLIRGYNITFKQIASPVSWYSGTWPPTGKVPASQILPGTTSGTTAATAASTPAGPAAAETSPGGSSAQAADVGGGPVP